ncbi:UDP-N-acetylmuramate dehydrogenase [Marinilabiliaceae bacterium JC017]|nr:UDP-N-acetylmuramate dehydrogenase [Marinilabiliaceae bacterium JC017]
MQIYEDYSLKEYNTFGIDVRCKHFITCTSQTDLQKLITEKPVPLHPTLIIGGGSNLLFTKPYEGTVIHPVISGIAVVNETKDQVFVEAGAGIVWDDLVGWCVDHDYYGIENLSLIPGHVGASPVQNIGAYGTEVKDCIHEVKGIFLESGEFFSMTREECQFGYRQSIFKKALKGKTIITSVVFKLDKQPVYNLTYGHLKEQVEKLGSVTLQNIRKAIIDVREAKLPDHTVIGNAGSFFKNPVISATLFNKLQTLNPQVPHYPADEGQVKVPAGWLIEKSGWKGKSLGKAGVHADQALVLINKGGASGRDIISLAETIERDVFNQFNIHLEREVNVI